MFELGDILRILLTGISYGMILFLIASGLSLIMGAMGILNLTHGSLYMLGAYIGLTLAPLVGNFWLAAVLSGLSIGLIGLILERGFLRQLYRQFNDQVLLTLGFVYIFGNAALWIWGSFPKLGQVPAALDFSIPMGRLNFPVYRLALIGVGLVIAGVSWYLQERTRAGAIVRAGMDDREMVLGLGINFGLMSLAIFLWGAFVAGFAGALGAPLIGASWDMGFPILIQALIVVIVGGVGRVEGTLLGALIIGLIDSLGKTFMPEFSLFTIYVVFILILLVKPSGLIGRVQVDEGAPPPTSFFKRATLSIPRTFDARWQQLAVQYGPYAVLILLVVLFPFVAPAYMRTTMTQIMIFSVFALSLNLLFGYTGLFSLGHAAFFGVAAYATAILSVHLDISLLWVLLPVGAVFAAGTAALVGLVALRVSGVYFLFVTLALGELFAAIALRWSAVTGGSNGLFGIPYPSLGLPVTIRAQSYYFVVLVVAAVCIFGLYRIVKSPFGLILQGIRDDEKRMQHLGYNTWAYKYGAFVISGLFAGIAGVMFAPFVGTVVPAYLGTATSALVMLMVIIGSAHLFAGPIVGVAIVLFLQYYVSIWAPARWPLVLGAVFVLSVMFLPGGVGQYIDRWWKTLRFERPSIEVQEEAPEHA